MTTKKKLTKKLGKLFEGLDLEEAWFVFQKAQQVAEALRTPRAGDGGEHEQPKREELRAADGKRSEKQPTSPAELEQRIADLEKKQLLGVLTSIEAETAKKMGAKPEEYAALKKKLIADGAWPFQN